jgi:uncharacterized membrane protein
MAVDISSEIVIRRPRDQVAAYSADPENAPKWYVNIKSVEWKTPPPLRLGSQIAFVANFLGRRMAYVYEIAELQTGQKLVMRTASGPFPMETTYEWQSVDTVTTRMTLRNRGNPSGFSRLVAPFMEFAMRRANRNDLARLKNILEAERP